MLNKVPKNVDNYVSVLSCPSRIVALREFIYLAIFSSLCCLGPTKSPSSAGGAFPEHKVTFLSLSGDELTKPKVCYGPECTISSDELGGGHHRLYTFLRVDDGSRVHTRVTGDHTFILDVQEPHLKLYVVRKEFLSIKGINK